MSDSRMLWKLAALQGATAVAFGAFGAHRLKKQISDPSRLANWATAAHYQLIHAVAMLISSRENPSAAHLFNAGIFMFSGSIYMLVLVPSMRVSLGPVTPLGGLCMIAGWAALAFGWGA